MNGPLKSNYTSNLLLFVPKQDFPKDKKKKSHYFAISSDDAFREKKSENIKEKKCDSVVRYLPGDTASKTKEREKGKNIRAK